MGGGGGGGDSQRGKGVCRGDVGDLGEARGGEGSGAGVGGGHSRK